MQLKGSVYVYSINWAIEIRRRGTHGHRLRCFIWTNEAWVDTSTVRRAGGFPLEGVMNPSPERAAELPTKA